MKKFINALKEGMGKISIFPNSKIRIESLTVEESYKRDKESLRKDWEEVGNDFKSVIGDYEDKGYRNNLK